MSKHEPITAENARTYLDIDTGWLSAVRREASRGAKVSPWLIATLSARIALAEAIIAANKPVPAPDDLLGKAEGRTAA